MTITQIVIIVAGLFFGYRLVSHMLSPGTGDDRNSHSPPGGPSGGNERQKRAYESAWTDAPGPSARASGPMWYQTLGIAESASMDEIDHAYRVQISQYHPDKVAKLSEDIRRLAEARSKEINAAYEIAIRLRR